MRHVVVTLDVVDVDRLGDIWLLVQITEVSGQVLIGSDALLVALEVPDVCGIKADQGDKKAPVGLVNLATGQESPVSKQSFQPVEGKKQIPESLFLAFLAGRKTRPVDAVIDLAVDTLIQLVYLGALFLRVQVNVGSAPLIPLRVQHADDLGRFVVDRGVCLLVPKQRYGYAIAEIGLGELVGIRQELEPVDRVGLIGKEPPATLIPDRINRSHRDHVFEALQLPPDDRPGSPRAGVTHVQVVTTGLCLESRGPVRGYPILKDALLSDKLAGVACLF